MYVKGEEGNSELEYAFLSWPGSLQPGSDCCLPLRGGGVSLCGRCLADRTDFEFCHAVVAATVVRKGEGPSWLDGADIELCFTQRSGLKGLSWHSLGRASY